MLVLTRKQSEGVTIGNVTVKVFSIDGNRVTIGIQAPRDVRIDRIDAEDRVQRASARRQPEVECEV